MPEFICEADAGGKPLEHVWSHTIGSGRAQLALRADWQAQMRRVHDELGCSHVRFHGILDDDMGVLLVQHEERVYGFHNVDLVVDFLLGIGMRPFVELSFMPAALASGERTVFSYRANVTPPKELSAWSELVGRLLGHWARRYGLQELRRWYFEVWNEPNLPMFWGGDQAAYFELYRHTAQAIKAVDTQLQVGGPATADDQWIGELVSFCESENVPLDFVTTHHYPNDAFGRRGDDTAQQLADATRGILRQRAQDASAAAGARALYYTEWGTSSNPFFALQDEPYAAAFIVKSFLEVADLVQGYSYWTFTDIFDENPFSSLPFHGGFGLLTIHGIAKPSYRAVQLLHRLGRERLVVDGTHATVDAAVVRDADALTVLLSNHAFPGHEIADERVGVELHTARRPSNAWVERIDADHCNPRRLWEAMGSPASLSAKQLRQIESASELQRDPLAWRGSEGRVKIELDLPAHGVAAATLQLGH